MQHWIVIYRDVDAGPLDFDYFPCQADDMEHADEQCEDAYPGCSIIWAEQTDSPQAAIDSWFENGTMEG